MKEVIIPGLQWYIVLVWVLVLLTWQTVRQKEPGGMARFIAALNSINTPWIAIIVIAQGMLFDVACQKFNISTDAATGVIGAGIGMLTAQGAQAMKELNQLRQQQNGNGNPSHPEASPVPDAAKE